MPSAPAFSRLQLAAALLEYDNNISDPNAPFKRAQDSAIFAHFRRNPAAPPHLSSRKSDYLGVSLPTETGSVGGRESLLDNRRSRASRSSIDALRNPFGQDDRWSDEEGIGYEEELEVDLASWGLDTLMLKEKEKGKAMKGKGRATMSPHAVSAAHSHFTLTNDGSSHAPGRAINTSRAVSLGGIAEYAALNDNVLEAASRRRKSFGSPMDLAGMEAPHWPIQRPHRSSYSAVQPSSSVTQPIPFPSSSARSPSPHPLDENYDRRASLGSRYDQRQSIVEDAPPRRTLSRASLDSKMRVQEEALQGMEAETTEAEDDNPFSIRPPSPSRLSRFDPKATAHSRRLSIMSGGSQMIPEEDEMPSDSQDPPKRERKFSTTLDLLRPKVLVMPSPLQPVAPEQPSPQTQVRDGFMLSTDGPPLPPGARSSRRVSTMPALDSASKPPIASNSFTPNPLMNLSLSQMTFRNTLHIDGQRDPYSEVIAGLPRATQEGEQVEFEVTERNTNSVPIPASASAPIGPGFARPAGKLYGKSLIDNLEIRKAEMRSKKRVFTGDQRPSMMSREQTRSSTLIDPATLNRRPTTQRQSPFGIPDSRQALSRRGSLNAKPLLNFDDEADKFKPSTSTTRILNSHSVFGVDTLWEREMVKLRDMQAQEEKEAEEQQKRMENEDQKRKSKKDKKSKKKKGREQQNEPGTETLQVEGNGPKVSVEPPVLPNIARAARPPPQVTENDAEDEESDAEIDIPTETPADDAGNWFSDSDEEGPRRTTGVGPRYPNRVRQVANDDSEEDIPLSLALSKAAERATRLQQLDDSDEEKPLSTLLQKKNVGIPPVNFDNLTGAVDGDRDGDGDDDDMPLGLRASTIPTRGANDDDDTPLAFHPEQQRRTQYQMLAQQQQQQQMMMQAQFQNSMFFSPPSMYGSNFFGPPVMPAMPMMMQPAMPAPSPPPAQDTAKFGRVDKWRHDVAVEGSL